MEELRNRIKENQNISDELKCNIATLTDALTTVFLIMIILIWVIFYLH